MATYVRNVLAAFRDGSKNHELGRDPMPVKPVSDDWQEITNPYIRIVLDTHVLHLDRGADRVDPNGRAGRERQHPSHQDARGDTRFPFHSQEERHQHVPAALVRRVFHPARVEPRGPAALVVPRELKVITLARHADRDIADTGPGIKPGAQGNGRSIERRYGAPGEAERYHELPSTLVEHAGILPGSYGSGGTSAECYRIITGWCIRTRTFSIGCGARQARRGMRTLLLDLRAFCQEHDNCGELDGGVESEWVWMTCTCGTS